MTTELKVCFKELARMWQLAANIFPWGPEFLAAPGYSILHVHFLNWKESKKKKKIRITAKASRGRRNIFLFFFFFFFGNIGNDFRCVSSSAVSVFGGDVT